MLKWCGGVNIIKPKPERWSDGQNKVEIKDKNEERAVEQIIIANTIA
jgi:hypothetical protein